MKTIPLTQGKFAIVDDDKYEWLNQWKWYARKCGKNKYYPARNVQKNYKSKTIYMHRLITGALPGFEVDHINGNSFDARRQNLRICQGQRRIRWITCYFIVRFSKGLRPTDRRGYGILGAELRPTDRTIRLY